MPPPAIVSVVPETLTTNGSLEAVAVTDPEPEPPVVAMPSGLLPKVAVVAPALTSGSCWAFSTVNVKLVLIGS